MSRYAEKHAHVASCYLCDDPATKLALIGSAPVWVCERHYNHHHDEHGRTTDGSR